MCSVLGIRSVRLERDCREMRVEGGGFLPLIGRKDGFCLKRIWTLARRRGLRCGWSDMVHSALMTCFKGLKYKKKR